MMEHEVKDALEARGHEVLRRGWPDFLVQRADGAVALVEVKHNGDQLHGDQPTMHEALATVGLPTVIVREADDLDRLCFVTVPNSASLRRQVADLKRRLADAEAIIAEYERIRDDDTKWQRRRQAERQDGVGRFITELYDLMNRTIGGSFSSELVARMEEARKEHEEARREVTTS